MSTVISPSLNLSGLQGAASGSRGRNAEEPEGRSFGAALERSRAASAQDAQQTAEASGTEPLAGRKTTRAADKKSELSADDVMALLAPLPAPVVPGAAQGKPTPEPASKGGAGATVDGLAAGAASGVLQEQASALADGAPQTAADRAAAKTARAADSADCADHDAHAEAPVAEQRDDAALPLATAAAAAATASKDASAKAAVPAPTPAAAGTLDAKTFAAVKAQAASDTTATATSADESAVAPQAAAAIETAKADTPAAKPDTASIGPAAAPDAQALAALQANAAPAADRAAAPAQSTPALTVAPQVGSTEWGPAIGHQMIRMSASGHQVAELNLNPANLGPLKVTLTMGDNQAQAMFVSAHESVRKAVEAALPQLRTTLAEQGINLGQTSVGAEARQPNGGSAFAEQNPQRPQGLPNYPGSGRADNTAAQPVAAAPSASTLRRATAGLDTFA
ncbi:flagellar hook-length control protein FliK [Variovorax sp. HW608]|uniref:flagellar hook-length control protein FliK n=1 Tax=Variovorax sp. HW608 TaxID=1034889 RepID=UPI00081FE36E|nr:flagellar hook-length control protein FliK [Variovorax sp. HW608]SCK60204.1 flagellar hook-length control protein FliK [Variovorax sp. HW608]